MSGSNRASGKVRIKPGLQWEKRWWQEGSNLVAGVDEAGRGALAGPVAAAAVILHPCESVPEQLREVMDSKLLSPGLREVLFDRIIQSSLTYGIALVSSRDIDRIGILPATCQAMSSALHALRPLPQAVLVDGMLLPDLPWQQQALIRGDRVCLSVAAASVLAKVARDRWMCQADQQYVGYGLAQHKGYGTAYHLAAMQRLGPSPIHRRSYAPVARLLRDDTSGEGR